MTVIDFSLCKERVKTPLKTKYNSLNNGCFLDLTATLYYNWRKKKPLFLKFLTSVNVNLRMNQIDLKYVFQMMFSMYMFSHIG